MNVHHILAIATTLGFSSLAHAADAPRVAALFTQTVTQGTWDSAGYAGFKAMADKDGFKPSYLENTSYEAAPAALRQLASDGVKLIVAHSSGYSAAIKEVAPSYPNTQFVLYSYEGSTANLPNYSAWSVDWDEYGFVLGALAASASKSGHIAVISGGPIPSAERTIQFIKKGATYVNPKVQVDSAYVGSFVDVARAKEIATGLIQPRIVAVQAGKGLVDRHWIQRFTQPFYQVAALLQVRCRQTHVCFCLDIRQQLGEVFCILACVKFPVKRA